MKPRRPLPRSTKPLKRSPIKKKRSKPRPGRLEGDDLGELRVACFARDRNLCFYGCPVDPELPHEDDSSAHMAHIQAKRRGGDSLSNVRTLCGRHHRMEHAYGKSMTKPCPPKKPA